MATTLTLFRANASDLLNPAEMLAAMNRSLARGNDSCMFVTAFCGCLDLDTGRLVFANAGHNPPFLVSAGQVKPLREPPGLVLGFLPDSAYKTFESTLGRGDTLFTYTDGLVEAQTAAGAFFGDARLVQALKDLADRTPEEMVKAVVDQVKAFEAGADPSDDLTLLAIRFGRRPTT
jgi:sigma-B regulation protein RsbU (phosphoserine phosphatase)